MDWISYQSFMTSKPFRFLVGPEKKEFHVHKELIAQLSPTLAALVNGQMKEAADGCVEWDDIDVDTFTRFAQFAYTKDYVPAEPEILLSSDNIEPEPSTPAPQQATLKEPSALAAVKANRHDEEDSEDSDYDSDEDESDSGDDTVTPDPQPQPEPPKNPLQLPYSLSSFTEAWASMNRSAHSANKRHHSGHSISKRKVDEAFPPPSVDPQKPRYRMMRRYVHLAENAFLIPCSKKPCHHETVNQGWKSRPNTEHCESYEEVFLSHAKLYVIGDKYGIPELRYLAIVRLHRTLWNFKIFNERIQDLVVLVRFVYDNSTPTDYIRRVVGDYMACIVEDVREDQHFRDLLREGGDFPVDLIDCIHKTMD